MPSTADQEEAAQSAPCVITQPAADGGLWSTQEILWQNHRQQTEQAVALVERDQRISALRAECDWLTSQLDQERKRRQALEPELDLARGEWAVAEKRASEFETSYQQAAAGLQQSEGLAAELARQLELVKTERSEAVLTLAQQHETVAELNLQLQKALDKQAELDQILTRSRAKFEQAAGELAAAETAAEQSASEASQLKATLAHVRAELGLAIAERDKLQGLVRDDHELSEYVEAKLERDRMDAELKETQARLHGLKEKIDSLTAEREALKKERKELQLTVAALRDAHDDIQLQQDNEVLRRMVERLNEELKEAQPEIARRKKREGSGGVIGGIARNALSRIMIPDPDIAQGR
jgi:chromosome segregation ATPase